MDLAYKLVNSAEINDVEYTLDMSFDNILRLIDLLNDEYISDYTKVHTGLAMLIGDELLDIEYEERVKIFIELFKSTLGSKKDDEKYVPVDLEGNPMPDVSENDKNAYDVSQDAEYIYASFMHTYQIDLFEQQGKLHWVKFKALLNGLSEDTIFSRIVSIRTAEMPTGKGTDKERERLRSLKRQYALKEDDHNET